MTDLAGDTRSPWRILGSVSRNTMLIQLLLIGNTVLMLYPILIMFFSAFKSTSDIFTKPFALPNFTNFANFARIIRETNFLTYFSNSILVTTASLACILIFGSMAAYAIARYRFRGATFLFLFFLAGLMVPLKLAIIPLFIQFRDLGILDTRLSLILLYTAMGLPSTVFILTGFLRTLPGELEDAARIDGASEPKIMVFIMMPLTKPALVIAGIHNAVPIWNDFFFPLVFIHTDANKTLPQGLTTFMGEFSTDWGALFAGLSLSALPIIFIYILLSRQFIAGMTYGSIK